MLKYAVKFKSHSMLFLRSCVRKYACACSVRTAHAQSMPINPKIACGNTVKFTSALGTFYSFIFKTLHHYPP